MPDKPTTAMGYGPEFLERARRTCLHTCVHDIGDFLAIDELVPVQILDLDVAGGRAQLSVKAARIANGGPRPLPSLVPGGKPFEWPPFIKRAGVAFREQRDEREERIDELEQELAAANDDLMRGTVVRRRLARSHQCPVCASEGAGAGARLDRYRRPGLPIDLPAPSRARQD